MKKGLFKVLILCVAVCSAIASVGCSGGSEPCTHANKSDWIVDKTATCTVLGEKHKECVDCGETVESVSLLADHSFTGGTCSVCRNKQGTSGLEFVKVSGKEEYSVKNIGSTTEKNVVIPTSHEGLPVTTIAADAFKGTAIESIELQDGIVTIDSSAFENCTSFSSITFGRNSKLSKIGDNAFKGCTAIFSIEFPASIKELGVSAFEGCSELYSVSFVDNGEFTTIGAKAFKDCDDLANINLPTSLRSISGYAFSGCTSLLTIGIPSGVLVFEEYAFFGCTQIEVSCGIAEIEKPQGWESKWNDIDIDGTKLSVDWNGFNK